ncbi:redox-sensitive transcriptional activator SoxR [Reinekea sp.]|jgi:MerR family redox-sensitive transcriptional activator SoxR|uniref:redox-sensitive transcriptional activator SoxR n=1 Tax=Reinekea sp. TaxID=1970455 RepID=UPI003988E0C8
MELTVGDVAHRSGVSVATLHFYEQKGLILSRRNAGNQRRYERSVLRRVAIIKTAQQLGFTLADIYLSMESLPTSKTPTKKDWLAMSKQWQHELDNRIAKLEKLRDNLGECIGCGCLSLQSCKLRNPDDTLAQQGSGAFELKDE